MDCELVGKLYSKMGEKLGITGLFSMDLFERIYRELTRALGGNVPDWVEQDTALYEIIEEFSEKFDKNELIHVMLSPSYFDPCDGQDYVKAVFEFFKGCKKIVFYPLELTLHLAALFKDRAISFIDNDQNYAGYLLQLANIAGVSVKEVKEGECLYITTYYGGVDEDMIKNFDKVVTFGSVPPKRHDLDLVYRTDDISSTPVSLFFKKGGRYEKILSEHPDLYPFIVESALEPDFFKGKIALSEIAKIERTNLSRFIEHRAVVFDGCRAEVISGEYAKGGSYIIKSKKPYLIKAVLNSSFMHRYLDYVPLKSIPIPARFSDKRAKELLKKIEDMENGTLGFKPQKEDKGTSSTSS